MITCPYCFQSNLNIIKQHRYHVGRQEISLSRYHHNTYRYPQQKTGHQESLVNPVPGTKLLKAKRRTFRNTVTELSHFAIQVLLLRYYCTFIVIMPKLPTSQEVITIPNNHHSIVQASLVWAILNHYYFQHDLPATQVISAPRKKKSMEVHSLRRHN